MTKYHPVDSGADQPERAVVLRVQLQHQSDSEVEASVAELRALLKGLFIRVEHTVLQKRSNEATLGSGRLKEVADFIGAPLDDEDEDEARERVLREPAADLVVFDGELAAGEARRMQKILGVTVIDRAEVILRVFRERAQTREAQLEIELAQLNYEAPRLRDDKSQHGRAGGGGRGEKGHTGVELNKQRIRERTAELRRQLAELHRTSDTHKARRAGTPRVALVGYTNAGKSSMMRALTGSEVLVEDKLFATLGTTVRALQPESTPRILVSDTVGFIRNLPHALIASFRATLAEAHEAELLLNVADASDPELPAQLQVTLDVLTELGAGEVPRTLVLNKVDRLDAARRAELAATYPDALFVSAHRPADVASVRQHILGFFEGQMSEAKLSVPYAELGTLAKVREEATVLAEEYTDDGVSLTLRASEVVLVRIERQFGERLKRCPAEAGGIPAEA
jgi:GTPase